MNRYNLHRLTFSIIVLIGSLLLFSCQKDDDNSVNNSNRIPVNSIAQLQGSWIHIATATLRYNNTVSCSLMGMKIEELTIASDSCSYAYSYYSNNSSRTKLGRLVWRSVNRFVMYFDSVDASFRHGDSTLMTVQLEGNVLRTEWSTFDSDSRSTYADLWIKPTAGLNTLGGVIRNSSSSPISGLPIYISTGSYRDSMTVSDQFGFFTITNVDVTPKVCIYRHGLLRYGNYQVRYNATIPHMIDFTVDVGMISGRANPARSRYGCSNVKITTIPPSDTVYVASDGKYSLRNIPTGTYSVVANGFGFEENRQFANVVENDTAEVNFSMTNLAVGSLRLIARDSSGQLPVNTILFHLTEPADGDAYTNSLGIAQFDSVPVGYYDLEVISSFYMRQTYHNVAITENDTAILYPQLYPNYGILSGYVCNEIDQTPVANVRVICAESADTVYTSSTGTFSTMRLRSGYNHVIYFDKTGFIHDSTVVSIYNSDCVTKRISPIPCYSPSVLTGHSDQVNCVRYSPSGSILASGGFDATIRLWTNTNNPINTIDNSGHVITALTFGLSDSLLYVGTSDGYVQLWSVPSGTLRHTFPQETSNIVALAVSRDGSKIAVLAYNSFQVRIYRTSDWSLEQTISNPSILQGINFNQSGSMLICNSDRYIYLYRISDGSLFRNQELTNISAVCCDSSGSMLAVACQFDIAILSATDLTILRHMYSPSTMIVRNGFSFFPSNSFLVGASPSNGSINFWTIANGTYRYTLNPGLNIVTSLAISPDGAHLAVCGSDLSIRVWDCYR